jgi:magnesium-transporting ATPase (P-type)
MSERGQAIMIWWALIFMSIFGFALWGLLQMMPPPPATLTAAEVAAFYTEHNTQIRLGAVVASWTSAFMVPFSTVVAIQMARLEKGAPVWSVLAFAGGILMSIFLVLPPIFWGIAAYTPTRPPEVTALMHEIGTLTLVTTDQFYIFQMIALTCVSLTQKVDANSPFPRWLGFFTLWAALAFEVGAIAFVPKTGPFAWNGALVYWMPLSVFGLWVTTVSISMLRALKRQSQRAAG